MATLTDDRGWRLENNPSEILAKTLGLSFDGETIDAGDMATLATTDKLTSLVFVDCVFDGEAPALSDLPVLENTDIVTLSLTGCEGITGNFPVGWSVATDLKTVVLNDCGYNAAALDAFLIAFAAAFAAGMGSASSSRTLNIAGTSNGIRTSASNTAATAIAVGWTITQNS